MNIFWPVLFVTFPWHCWTQLSQSWKDLRKTLRSHEKLWSMTDLSGANIGIHSNSRDLLFWMLMISKINPLLNERVQFWKDMKTAFYIFIKNSRNAIPKYEHIIATHLLSTFTFTKIVQALLCWFHRMFVVWNIRNKVDKTFVRTK